MARFAGIKTVEKQFRGGGRGGGAELQIYGIGKQRGVAFLHKVVNDQEKGGTSSYGGGGKSA